ncbi:MAG: glycosyltransferase family 1 protein [Patescibacteria group bacterium]
MARIGIDARFVGPEGKGLGRYGEKLIEMLQELDSTNEYVIFLRDPIFSQWKPARSNFQKVEAPFRWYTAAEQIHLPRLIARHKIDLMHFPHLNVPLLYRRPFVVTIHDLTLTHYPTQRATTLPPLLYKIKQFAYHRVMAHAVHRAAKIITVSGYAKNDILEFFHVPKEKITVTYEGAASLGSPHTRPEDVLASHGIRPPYLLYVGNAYPHKNLERLLEAFAILRKQHSDYQLVLVGKMEYFYERIVRLSQKMELEDAIRFPGYVPDHDLVAFYQKAAAYVFPSLSEGFGLPPLEAMLYGTPVVSSNATCLPEILQNAAIYVDPNDPEDMADGIHRLLSDDHLRQQFIEHGRVRVKNFSWKKMAEETIVVYQSLLKSPSS